MNKDERNGSVKGDYIKKLPESLAVLAIHQLNKIDILNKKRLINAEIWHDWSKNNNFNVPTIVGNSRPVYLRYPLLVDEGKKKIIVKSFKGELNIGDWMYTFLTGGSKRIQPNHALLPNAKYAIEHAINLPCL